MITGCSRFRLFMSCLVRASAPRCIRLLQPGLSRQGVFPATSRAAAAASRPVLSWDFHFGRPGRHCYTPSVFRAGRMCSWSILQGPDTGVHRAVELTSMVRFACPAWIASWHRPKTPRLHVPATISRSGGGPRPDDYVAVAVSSRRETSMTLDFEWDDIAGFW